METGAEEPTRPGGGAGTHRHRLLGPAGVVLAFGTVVVLLVATMVSGVPVAGGDAGSGAQAFSSMVCNPPNLSPSALDIPLGDVGTTLDKGSTLIVSYEIGVTHAARAVGGRLVYLPSLNGVFPVVGGGTVSVFEPPRNLTLSSNAWSLPINLTKTLTQSEDLASTTPATLTSSKIAVLSNSSYGVLTLEFRWSYVATPFGTNQSRIATAWTIPNASSTAPYLPSIFFPADFVGLNSTSARPATTGSIFTLKLTGTVVNTTFRVVVEFPSNGTETFSQWETGPPIHGPFVATANLSFVNGTPLPPGSYLIHVHDRCEAIVIILNLTVDAKTGGIMRVEPAASR
jgi:hypothetical protein